MAASVLLLIATGCLAVGLRERHGALAFPGGRLSSATEPPGSSVSGRRGAAGPAEAPSQTVARSAPVALSIPAIGLSVSVSKLGLEPDGTVEVPTDFQEPGWFRLGPSPGQAGSAVILGHVDSYSGPAVFLMLRFLHVGDRVKVTLTNGMVARFVVTKVATYPSERFPARRVYGPHGDSALQLVTCGGEFDTETQHYLSNVVVYTSLVRTTPAVGRHRSVTKPVAATG